VLTQIYGEEDWSATIRKAEEETEEDNVIPLEPRQPHRDRMAGLT
jgi:phosphonate transport system ATP-binding protein